MALVAGTTDPALLADLARGKLRKQLPELRQALAGRCGPHHRFMVSRLLADIDYVEEASRELSRRIEELLACVWRIATYCQAQQFAHAQEAPKSICGTESGGLTGGVSHGSATHPRGNENGV